MGIARIFVVAVAAMWIGYERAPEPPAAPPPSAKVALGKRLFSERRLSADGSISCNDCHDLARGGTDGRPVAIGIHGRKGTAKTPTVFNVDADRLEKAVDRALLDDDQMGGMWVAALEKLRADPSYVAAFGADGISPTTVRSAIVTFERTLR